MIIKDNKTLRDIQKEFKETYPFLKIEFYSGRHESGKGSPKLQQLDSKSILKEVRTIHSEGELSIRPDQKISTLESNFAEMYGLNVQVFRMSGNLWLQTSRTDSWTLAEADLKGEHSVGHFHNKSGT